MTGIDNQTQQPRTVNERGDDPDARPMLYDPLQGGTTTKAMQFLATAIVCMGAAAAGTGLSWTSPSQDLLTNTTLPSPFHITKGEMTVVASLLSIGAIFGAIPCGILADKVGRKKAAMLITIPYIISYIMTACAQGPAMLYVARILIGIAIGGSCVVCPVFISEFAETSIRGTLGTCFQLFLTVGILFVYVVGHFLGNWVTLSWTLLGFPILNLVGLFILPESPIWLLKNNRESDAASAIKFYWGRQCNAGASIQVIKNELDSAGGSGTIRDLFAVVANRRGFIICILLMFFQQFSGINAVIFFAQNIFKSAGSTLNPGIATIIIGVVQVAMTFVAAVLVERAGRKILLLLSSVLMCLCLVVLGIFFFIKKHDEATAAKIAIIPLLSMILFIVAFSLGYGPIPWMMMGEMLGADVKDIASSITVNFNWICVFIVTLSFEPAKDLVGDAAPFWFFGVIMAAGTVYVFARLFETKGKSSTEIQVILAGDK